MRVVNGMHWPNHRPWNIEQALRAARPTGSVTILHHQMLRRDELIDQFGDVENEYVFVKLRDGWPPQGIPAAPERFVHVRMYVPNWSAMDPVVWARHAVDKLSRIESGGRVYDLWADPFVGVSAANEQNLHYENGDNDPANQWKYRTPEHYAKIGRWNLTFWREVDRLRPDRKALAVWSALAYGHDAVPGVPESEYAVPELREAIRYCDLAATHPYGQLKWPNGPDTVPGGADQFWHMLRDFRPAGFDGPHDPGGFLAQFPDMPLLLTESGTFTHSRPERTTETIAAMRGLLQAAAASGRVLGVTWFIWNSDDSHADNVIWPNGQLRDLLEQAADYPTTLAVPVHRPGGGEPPPPPPSAEDPFVGTLVRRGEGLFAVARRVYGEAKVATNARRIADHNGLPWPSQLATGQLLRLPGFDIVPKAQGAVPGGAQGADDEIDVLDEDVF